MAKTAQQIYNEIIAYVNSGGGGYSTWYAGITSNIDSRLFGDHGVSQQNGLWIWRQASSATSARNVEDALLKAGFDGGPGGGDDDCTNIYCYKKTSITVP